MERWLGWPTLQQILSTYFARVEVQASAPPISSTATTEVPAATSWFFDQMYRSSNVFDYGVQDLKSTRDRARTARASSSGDMARRCFRSTSLVTFENGERVTEHWDGRDRWKLYGYDRPSAALSAEVDPNRVLLLDVNVTNNSKTLPPRGRRAATKWSTKWMVWLQDCLLSWASLRETAGVVIGLAWVRGMRRVNRAPAILVGVWALTLLVSLPLTLALRGMLAEHLGGSLAADTAADGVNYDWMQEFGDQATGLGVTFKPTIVGFGAVLDNLSAFHRRHARPVVIVGAAWAYIVLWLFFAGGILDRYARDHATRTHGFFSASGVFFFRFLRLAVVQWIVYAFLFGCVHRWLFERLFTRVTHEMTVERTAFLVRVGLYVVFGVVLAACTLVFDYAKVRAVVEDRRSMLGAIVAALGFIRRNYGAASDCSR